MWGNAPAVAGELQNETAAPARLEGVRLFVGNTVHLHMGITGGQWSGVDGGRGREGGGMKQGGSALVFGNEVHLHMGITRGR